MATRTRRAVVRGALSIAVLDPTVTVLAELIAPAKSRHWHIGFGVPASMPRFTVPIATRAEANKAAIRWKRALARSHGVRWTGDVRGGWFTPLPTSKAPVLTWLAVLACELLACPYKDAPIEPGEGECGPATNDAAPLT